MPADKSLLATCDSYFINQALGQGQLLEADLISILVGELALLAIKTKNEKTPRSALKALRLITPKRVSQQRLADPVDHE